MLLGFFCVLRCGIVFDLLVCGCFGLASAWRFWVVYCLLLCGRGVLGGYCCCGFLCFVSCGV